jgi:hypothetical protein
MPPFVEAARTGGVVGGLKFVEIERSTGKQPLWATEADSGSFKLVVPLAMRSLVVAAAHERFRCCSSATKERLLSRCFWWPEMEADIKRFTVCADCARHQ